MGSGKIDDDARALTTVYVALRATARVTLCVMVLQLESKLATDQARISSQEDAVKASELRARELEASLTAVQQEQQHKADALLRREVLIEQREKVRLCAEVTPHRLSPVESHCIAMARDMTPQEVLRHSEESAAAHSHRRESEQAALSSQIQQLAHERQQLSTLIRDHEAKAASESAALQVQRDALLGREAALQRHERVRMRVVHVHMMCVAVGECDAHGCVHRRRCGHDSGAGGQAGVADGDADDGAAPGGRRA